MHVERDKNGDALLYEWSVIVDSVFVSLGAHWESLAARSA